jgi:hypothetical protein
MFTSSSHTHSHTLGVLQRLLGRINNFSFDIFAVHDFSTARPLLYTGWAIINYYDFPGRLGVVPMKLINFLRGVEYYMNVNGNPYHCSLHAADVLQTCHSLIGAVSKATMSNFSDLEVFCLFIAAILHDFKHPAFTNQFLLDSLATNNIPYTKDSVLETYHIAAAFRFCQKEEFDIFSGFQPQQKLIACKTIRELILATNLAVQKEFMNDWNEVCVPRGL